VLNDLGDSRSVVQLVQPRLVENQIKIKQEDGCEKKKTLKKKNSGDIIPTPVYVYKL